MMLLLLPKNNLFFCGYEIHIITQLGTGHGGVCCQAKYLSGQPAAIGMVGDDETDKRSKSDKQRSHVYFKLRLRVDCGGNVMDRQWHGPVLFPLQNQCSILPETRTSCPFPYFTTTPTNSYNDGFKRIPMHPRRVTNYRG